MRFSVLCAIALVTGSVVGFFFPTRPQAQSAAQAQTAPPSPAASGGRSNIAVIDVSHVFKNHVRFKQAMENMKKEVESFEGELKEKGRTVQELVKKRDTFKPGTPQYKQYDEKIATAQADGQAKAALKRKEMLDREARIYHNVYKEIQDETARFAQRAGIDLVVRFNSEPINQEVRQSVLEGVNRAVVYQNKLNITFHILDRLNGGATATRPPAAGATTPR